MCFIEGNKICLREVQLSDVDNGSYYEWLNDSEVNQYLESRFMPNSKERMKKYLSSVDGDSSNILFAIVEKITMKHVGNIKLGPVNWIHRSSDIGLLLGKENWGKGFGTEAISLIVDYAFNTLNLNKITAGAYSVNIGSIKAFQKNNFAIEGTLKKQYFYKGSFVDGILLGLVKK
jgi:[ribosomal protein S5]-alanine N-acetyltransferase